MKITFGSWVAAGHHQLLHVHSHLLLGVDACAPRIHLLYFYICKPLAFERIWAQLVLTAIVMLLQTKIIWVAAGDLDKHLFLNMSNKHVLFSFKNPKISSWFVSLEGA